MSSTAEGLKHLHQLLKKLEEVEQQLTHGPRKIRAQEKVIEKKEAELKEKRDQINKLKVAGDQKSLQLRSNETKINDLKVKLNAASSNREFEIIKSQIDADSMANSVLEDEILETLERVDTKNREFAQLQDELKQSRQRLEDVKKTVAEDAPKLHQQIEELQGEISQAENVIDGEDVRAQYRRMKRNHGAKALAAVENNACTNCYVTVSPQTSVELRTGQMVFCRSCGRLQYPADA